MNQAGAANLTTKTQSPEEKPITILCLGVFVVNALDLVTQQPIPQLGLEPC